MTADQSIPALKVEDVHVAYGKHEVIKGLSLDVRNGETFGLIGLNGVGKTTLIKTVLGLREYDSGQIKIEGKDRHHPESKKLMAFLPERFEPPWFLTGIEFLRFSMTLYGLKPDDEVLFEKAEQLALERKAVKSRVQTYSKGMRQKLGILATLMTGCPLMILDEPMSGLDPMARTMVKDMLQEARAAGRTVFLSSHILADMNEICDRVGVLSAGTLVFTGTPAELKKQGGNDNMERAFLSVIEK